MKIHTINPLLTGFLLTLGWVLFLLPGCSNHFPANDKSILPAAGGPGEARAPMMMRSGRPVVKSLSPADLDMHKPLTPPGISAVWTAPKKPPPYQALRAGGRHYFGFEITPDFEKATKAFLAGDGEAALRYYKRAEEDPHSGAAGAWRNAYEYVITLIQTGRPDLAGAERMELLDYIWHLEARHGEAFGRLGQMEQAESSLRRAQTVVDRISETMTTDGARIRFGSGKEKVTRHLVEIDVGKKDFDSLFQDMER